MIGVSVMFSVMNYGLVNCALSSYISASRGVKVFLLLQFRNELWGEERPSKTFPGKVRRTADPSASLGMTKERAIVPWKSSAELKH